MSIEFCFSRRAFEDKFVTEGNFNWFRLVIGEGAAVVSGFDATWLLVDGVVLATGDVFVEIFVCDFELGEEDETDFKVDGFAGTVINKKRH